MAPGADYGPNNENLPERLYKPILKLAQDLEKANQHHRNRQVKKAVRNRWYWKNFHYLWWSDSVNRYKVLGIDDPPANVPVPRYDHVIPVYSSYGLAYIAITSEGKLKTKFYPQDPDTEEDVESSKAASVIAEVIESNNEMDDALPIQESWHEFVDGFYGYYVRYVVDGELYGYDEVPVLGSGISSVGEEGLLCDNCGAMNPAEVEEPDFQVCQSCGGALSRVENAILPQPVEIPVQMDVERFPKGQVTVSLASRLELRIPPQAKTQNDVHYINYVCEIHRAKIAATYKHVAEKVKKFPEGEARQGGGSAHNAMGTALESFERQSRLDSTHASFEGQGLESDGLVTFERRWLRPWTLFDLPYEEAEEMKVRDELMALFPNGIYLASFGDTYVESRNEAMDDYWVLYQSMPGEGFDREAVGDAGVGVQKIHNTMTNLEIETYERGIATTFVRPDVVDLKKFTSHPSVPGSFLATLPSNPNRPLAEGFFQTTPARVSEQMIGFRQELFGPIAQHSYGTLPAAYGGDLGSNDTASGIAMERNQAKGRLGIYYRARKAARARAMLRAVECFRKNQMEDLQTALWDPASNNYKSKVVHLEQLRGSLKVKPESEESYPTSWAEKEAKFNAIFANAMVAPLLMSPQNLTAYQRLSGLPELKIEGLDAYTKQMREIELLLEHGLMGIGPIEGVQAAMDPETGAPTGQLVSVLQPSIPIDELLDNHQMEFKAGQDWNNTDAAAEAKINNPMGFLNVRLHLEAHSVQVQKAMLEQAMMAAGGPPQEGEKNAA